MDLNSVDYGISTMNIYSFVKALKLKAKESLDLHPVLTLSSCSFNFNNFLGHEPANEGGFIFYFCRVNKISKLKKNYIGPKGPDLPPLEEED